MNKKRKFPETDGFTQDITDLEEDDDDNFESDFNTSVLYSPSKQSRLNLSSKGTSSAKIKEDKHDKCIIHIDMDCFYAQVEMLLCPELRNVPLGVRQKHCIVTANYIAREMGVTKLSSVTTAKKCCPNIVIIDGECLDKYRSYSDKVYELWHQFSDKVEKLGMDENFIDVTSLVARRLSVENEAASSDPIIPGHVIGMNNVDHKLTVCLDEIESSHGNACSCGCHRRIACAAKIALEMRTLLYEDIGLTSCGGIAHNKLLAKMVGTKHKPNQQTAIFPEQAESFMRSQPFSKVPGIGSRCQETLVGRGIKTIGDLVNVERHVLCQWYGTRHGDFLWYTSRGIDSRTVENSGEAKSISEEDTYKTLDSIEKVQSALNVLLSQLINRITTLSGYPKTLRLTIRKRIEGKTQKRESRQTNLLTNADLKTQTKRNDITRNLLGQLLSLLKKMLDFNKPFNLALLNIAFANIDHQSHKTGVSSYFKESGTTRPTKDIPNDLTSIVTSGKSSTTDNATATESSNGLNFSTDILKHNTDTIPDSFEKDSIEHGESTLRKIVDPPYRFENELIASQQLDETATLSTAGPAMDNEIAAKNRPIETNMGGSSCSKTQHETSNNLLKSSKENSSPSCSKTKIPISKNDVPDNIDRNVFQNLPPEIQQELIMSWGKPSHSSVNKQSKKSLNKNKRNNGKKNDNNKSIVNYFKPNL